MWSMARLTQAYHPDDESYVNIGRRHLPFVAGENIMMLVDLNSRGLVIDSPKIRGRELEEFTRKFNLLTTEELHKALEIDESDLISVLNQCVQCVGCRRRVERLFYQLTLSGHPTLYPLVLSKTCKLTISEEKLKSAQTLGTLLYRHHENLTTILEKKLRTKTRCILHSLDAFRSKPFSETWREVWSAMNHNCRDELAVIETYELHEVLENYLKKHKFCTGCKAKIDKAYKILIGTRTTKEKGYVPSLYANIKKCQSENHVHVATNKIDFLDALIRRAEPEVNGSYSKLRERHAKTLEIAQEEVLICVGMIMYERLRRIYVSSREEEHACQVLAAVGVHALSRSFDTFVERKQGISNLELLYQEMSKAEKAKEIKREQKKLKKKMKKNEKKINQKMNCEVMRNEEAEHDADNESDAGFHQDDNNSPVNDEEDEIINNNNNNNDKKEDLASFIDDIHQNCASLNSVELIKNNSTSITLSEVDEINCKNVQCQSLDKTNSGANPVSNKNTKTERKKKQKQKAKQKKNKKAEKKNNIKNDSIGNEISDNALNPSCHQQDEDCFNEKCSDCYTPGTNCPCENDVKDSGYGSEIFINSPMSSTLNSPDGSEVSCSDGLCNHETNDLDDDQPDDLLILSPDFLSDRSSPAFVCNSTCCNFSYTLQELVDEFDYQDVDDEKCYIPEEVLLEYKYNSHHIENLRQQLRQKLRDEFSLLCLQSDKRNSAVQKV